MSKKITTYKFKVQIYLRMISLVFFIPMNYATAQIKIYVVTDLEGVSGVYKFAQTREKDTPSNIQACEYFMDDLAAVVHGLRDGGATEIIILDGHGSGSIIPHMMEPGAVYITGRHREGGYLWGLDRSFSGLVLFGYHAMKGTADGVLNHTGSSRTESRFWYNGVESGEIAQIAATAGHYGVPPILVTGDVATCREARTFFGPEIVTVATKQGISREAAALYPFKETRKALYEGAKRAINEIPKCKPYLLELPIKAKKEYIKINSNLPNPPILIEEKTFQDASHNLNF